MVLRPFCACSTIFCFCLFSFPRRFYHSRLALFRFATCLYLISSCVSCCVCHFLWFGFSFLHAILVADTSCYSSFLFIMLLHISFHAYLFIQKDLSLCGPNNVDRIKKVLGPICLYLPKPFSWRTVFCSKTVFYCRFVSCCRSLSFTFLSLDLSYSLVLLVGLLDLAFYWTFPRMGFWVQIQKMGLINLLVPSCTYMYFSLLDFWTGVCAQFGYEKRIYLPRWNQTQLTHNSIMALQSSSLKTRAWAWQMTKNRPSTDYKMDPSYLKFLTQWWSISWGGKGSSGFQYLLLGTILPDSSYKICFSNTHGYTRYTLLSICVNISILLLPYTLCLFRWKTFCKDSFPHFSVFGSTKKTGQWKTNFGQRKTVIKIRLIFYRLFSKKYFWKTISLSLVTSPINIIFVCSCGKHYFLAPSLSHGKIFHFFSPHTLTISNSSLSFSHRSFSLLSFLHASFPLCNTIFWLYFFLLYWLVNSSNLQRRTNLQW